MKTITTETPTPSLGRKDMLLLLIGSGDERGERGLGGITRIQKLLFLLETEEHIKPRGDGFQFEAYKAGPYSAKIYDDLEFLENLNLIARVPISRNTELMQGEFSFGDLDSGPFTPEATDAEKSEVDLSFDELMGPEDILAPGADEVTPTSDSYQESRYYITEHGKKKLEELLSNKSCAPFVSGIRRVKSKFARYSLNDLLYHVYTRYPNWTTESEIKEKVLRKRQMH